MCDACASAARRVARRDRLPSVITTWLTERFGLTVPIVTACPAECNCTIRPSTGARSASLTGSMDTPSPTIFWAKTAGEEGEGDCVLPTLEKRTKVQRCKPGQKTPSW